MNPEPAATVSPGRSSCRQMSCGWKSARRTSIGWSELFSLKRLFGVSVQALVYRCRDLGIINEALFRRLFQNMSKQGWRSPPYREPQEIPSEEPTRFERLCSRALAEKVISEAKAAELLGISVRELHGRMEQPRDSSRQPKCCDPNTGALRVCVSDTSILIDL